MPSTPPSAAQLPILAAALHASLAFYGVVPFVVVGADATPVASPLALPLTLVALAALATAVLLPRVWPTGDRGARPLFPDLSAPDPARFQLALVRMAVAESAALLGLVVAIVARTPLVVAPFLVGAAIVQVAVGPFGSRLIRGS